VEVEAEGVEVAGRLVARGVGGSNCFQVVMSAVSQERQICSIRHRADAYRT